MSRRAIVTIALVLLALLWASGRMDHALAGVGLNRNDCATNGFGATFCGAELDRYNREVVQPAQQAERDAQDAADAADAENAAAYCDTLAPLDALDDPSCY